MATGSSSTATPTSVRSGPTHCGCAKSCQPAQQRFGVTTPVIGALARETKTIPIVFAGVSDPIGSGFAANLAHPGGNITGFMSNDPAGTLGGKWVELLKEIAPRTVPIELLFNPATAVPLQYSLPSIQAAAFSFAVPVNAAPVHAKEEIEGVIAAQTRDPGGGLIVMPDVRATRNFPMMSPKTSPRPSTLSRASWTFPQAKRVSLRPRISGCRMRRSKPLSSSGNSCMRARINLMAARENGGPRVRRTCSGSRGRFLI
jgi:hypothetical protein